MGYEPQAGEVPYQLHFILSPFGPLFWMHSAEMPGKSSEDTTARMRLQRILMMRYGEIDQAMKRYLMDEYQDGCRKGILALQN